MTETVLGSLDEWRRFRHYDPKPFAVVKVLGGRRGALKTSIYPLGLLSRPTKSTICSD